MGLSDTEKRTEQLKNALRSGRMTAEELKSRLRMLIDAELAKDSRDIDTGFVTACDDLLTELSPGALPHEAGYFDRQWELIRLRMADRAERKRRLIRSSVIAAAAVLIVVLLGTVSFQMRWFRPYSTPDGLEYRIDGQQISIQSVAEAINEREVGTSYQTERMEEIEAFLGFSLEGSVPVLEGWKTESFSAENLEKEIRLDIIFRRAGQAEDSLHYLIRWITDFSYLYEATHPEGEGEYVTVSGSSVFRREEDGGVFYTWSRGMEVYELTGPAADEIAEAFVSLNPVKDEPVTEEMLQKVIEKYYPGRGCASEQIEDVESFLGFSLSGVVPVPEGWELENSHAAVFPDAVFVSSRLRPLERYDVSISYTVHWVLDREGLGYTIEQDEEGKYLTVDGRTVYRSTNYGHNVYVWLGKNVFYTLNGEPEIDEVIGLFVNPGAEKAGADSKADVSGTKPGSPSKTMETGNRQEAERYLGLSLKDYLPDMEDWEEEKYTVEQEGGKTVFRAVLKDSFEDGGELVYQAAWLPDYESYRDRFLSRDQKGRYRLIEGWEVFRNVSGAEPSYTWYRGPTVQTLSGPSADEWIRRFLKVGVKEKTPVEGEEETEEEEPEPLPMPPEPYPDVDGATGVSRAMLSELLERYGRHSGITTDDLHEAEEFLGFSPKAVLPVLPGWETEYYFVTVDSAAVNLRAVMKDAQRDHETLNYSVSWYIDDRYLWKNIKRIEETKESSFINGLEVYRNTGGKETTYEWFDGFTDYYLNGASAEEVVSQFVNAAGK